MRQLRADQLAKCEQSHSGCVDNIKELEAKLKELFDLSSIFNEELKMTSMDADSDLLAKIKETSQKAGQITGDGQAIDKEKEKLKQVLTQIADRISKQDWTKVDMTTIKQILSDLEGVNGKTDAYIVDVVELIAKL